MGLSSFSTSAMGDVVKQGEEMIDYAIQLYVFQSRKTSEALVRRAEIGTPYLDRRINEVRNRFRFPLHLQLLNPKNPPNIATLSDSATDIFEALALGAGCCWIGRIPLWGLAYDGQAGVELALKMLYDEFKLCMSLAGCGGVKEISKDHLIKIRNDGTLARL